jgi:hypothetical protein
LPDQNGDGRHELLVGVPRSSEQATWAGAVLLYFGTVDLDAVPDLVFLGENAGDEFGSSLAVAADLEGDGQPDFLVGAPLANLGSEVDAGKAYLFCAGTALDSEADLTFTGTAAQDRFGKAVAAGFDWNGDGEADLAVGASGYDDGTRADAGAGFVFFAGDLLDATPDTTVIGSVADAHLGTSAVAAGDVRSNGRGTLLLGGYNAGDTGRALLFGSDQSPSAVSDGIQVAAAMAPPWPNPFNPRVETRLRLQSAGRWRIAVFDLRGQRVALLEDRRLEAGEHRVVWNGLGADGRPQPSGRYLLQALGPEGSVSVSLTLLR